jgi:hypothetical protein
MTWQPCLSVCVRLEGILTVQDDLAVALRHVAVILVSPKHAANVGAVTRVCDNFEVRFRPGKLHCNLGCR